jgi:hypothetical protein
LRQKECIERSGELSGLVGKEQEMQPSPPFHMIGDPSASKFCRGNLIRLPSLSTLHLQRPWSCFNSTLSRCTVVAHDLTTSKTRINHILPPMPRTKSYPAESTARLMQYRATYQIKLAVDSRVATESHAPSAEHSATA